MQSPELNHAESRASEGQLSPALTKPQFTFSIITATYNRAHLLERVFRSLEEQSFRDFEWIVVDDQSTDGTAEAVRKMAAAASFPVHYLRQQNGGKLVAVNRAIQTAKGYFLGVQDDDDWYLPNALERCWTRWQEIPEENRNQYVGLAALAAYPDGRVVGTRFPQDILDSDSIEIRSVHRVKGDKKSFLRAEVFRQYPFPENLTRYTPEAIVWNRIALRYKTRFVNEVWGHIDYQADGMSATRHIGKIPGARGMWLSASELLDSGKPMNFWFSLRTQSTFARFFLHDRALTARALREIRERASLAGLALGLLLYARDKYRALAHRVDPNSAYLTVQKS
jgi:glycosyltransferase involved in cell wall biosynthesis